MKNSIFLIIGLIMMCLITLSNNSVAAAPPTTAKPIELIFAHHVPVSNKITKPFDEWMKRIEEQSQGRVKFKYYPGGTLVKPQEAYDSLLGGICDINFVYAGYEPERWGLNSVFGQSAIRLPANENASRVWDELWNKFPEMRKEFQGVEALYKVVGIGSTIHHAKKEIRLPKDIIGSRVIVTGFNADFIKECGASPVDLPAQEFYMSLERGVADSIMVSWLTLTGRGCSNVVRYHTELNMGQNAFCLLMNAKKWASLPEDIQKIIRDNTVWARAQYYIIENQEQILAKEKTLALPGHVNIVPTPEEMDQWLQYAMPAAQKWIAKQESSGKPGKAVFEETLRLSKSIK